MPSRRKDIIKPSFTIGLDTILLELQDLKVPIPKDWSEKLEIGNTAVLRKIGDDITVSIPIQGTLSGGIAVHYESTVSGRQTLPMIRGGKELTCQFRPSSRRWFQLKLLATRAPSK